MLSISPCSPYPLAALCWVTPRLVVTLLAFALVVAPHVAWFLENTEFALGASYKLKIAEEGGRWHGLASLLAAVVDFLVPLGLIYAWLLRRQVSLSSASLAQSRLFIRRYLVSALGVLVAGVLTFGVAHVSSRWLIPLLFAVPLAYLASEGDIPTCAYRWFSRLAITIAIAIPLALMMRATLWPLWFEATRYQFPIVELVQRLRDEGYIARVVLADTAHLAGNLIYHLPGSVAYSRLASMLRSSMSGLTEESC